MAATVRNLGIADNGAVEVDLTYDNVSGVISSISLTNNGTSGTMTATLFDRTTGAPIFGPSTRTFGTGTVVQNLSSLNLSMVATAPGRFSPDGWATPFGYSLSWSSA